MTVILALLELANLFHDDCANGDAAAANDNCK